MPTKPKTLAKAKLKAESPSDRIIALIEEESSASVERLSVSQWKQELEDVRDHVLETLDLL